MSRVLLYLTWRKMKKGISRDNDDKILRYQSPVSSLFATTETLSGTHQQQQHAVNSSPVYSVIISCWSPTHHHQHRITGPSCLSACLILLSSSFVVVPKTNSSLVLSALVDELPQQQQLSMLNKGEYGDGTDRRRLTLAPPIFWWSSSVSVER